MFKVKNKLFLLLHVSILLLFLGCDESLPKSQNYINHNNTLVSFSHIKIDNDTNNTKKRKKLFSQESVINKDKLQHTNQKKTTISSWWIYAIFFSLIIVIYFIVRLMKKQKIILENLKKLK